MLTFFMMTIKGWIIYKITITKHFVQQTAYILLLDSDDMFLIKKTTIHGLLYCVWSPPSALLFTCPAVTGSHSALIRCGNPSVTKTRVEDRSSNESYFGARGDQISKDLRAGTHQPLHPLRLVILGALVTTYKVLLEF